ncbi:MAG TPA: hypothetical protein VM029_00775, partial [Opitutaceae bacterium]|nr:hypothetical protein [Opitutaceae bacterium]
TDNFTYWASDGVLESRPATVTFSVLPVNHMPVAVARVFARAVFSNTFPALVISENNFDATLILDGANSSDRDGDALAYTWFETDVNSPFARGARTTNTFPVGTHEFVLRVADGSTSAIDRVQLRIIRAGEAVRILAEQVTHSALPIGQRQSLVALLNAAESHFDREHTATALTILGAFERAVARHLMDSNAAAIAFLQAVEMIRRATELSPHFTEVPRAIPIPALQIRRHDYGVTISWPLTASDFVLEQRDMSPSIGGPSEWISVPLAARTNEGGFFVEVSIAAEKSAFRLRQR